MKKLFILFSLVFITMGLFAQNPDSLKYNYAEVIAYIKTQFKTTAYLARIDDGIKPATEGLKLVPDQVTGKPMEWPSQMAVLNYFTNQGWEYIQTIIISVPQEQYHFILRKAIK